MHVINVFGILILSSLIRYGVCLWDAMVLIVKLIMGYVGGILFTKMVKAPVII